MKSLSRNEFLQKCSDIYDDEAERGKVINMLAVIVKKRSNGEVGGGLFMGRKGPSNLKVVNDA